MSGKKLSPTPSGKSPMASTSLDSLAAATSGDMLYHSSGTHFPTTEIKVKTLSHLHLTDPSQQFARWFFSFKNHLITIDPVYEELFDGSDDPRLIQHERQLAYLLTALVKDGEAKYVVAGRIRLNKQRPGSCALKGLTDTYQFDPVEHSQRLKMELHRPIQPGNTLRGYLHDLDRIRTELEDLGQQVPDSELIACLVNGLKFP